MDPNAGIDAYVANYSPIPWAPPGTRAFAGLARRLFALILDIVICWFAQSFLSLAIIGTPLTGFVVLLNLTLLVYLVLLDSTGGTLGKRAFRIKAVDQAGATPGIWQSLLRRPLLAVYTLWKLGFAVIGTTVIGLIGDLQVLFGALFLDLLMLAILILGSLVDGIWMFDDPRNQTLHDKLAGTFVIEA